MTTEIINLCDKRREVSHEEYTNLESMANYQKARSEVRKKMKETCLMFSLIRYIRRLSMATTSLAPSVEDLSPP
ncbi:hypothetical protein DPMN_072171 [Dreissena polymorpha]|uniref:Uncharacterized protein n=1 Tax=Dreissena polymorpha TaxID=45954 RepID=A0A9D3Z930_DREPO|nr:hypothetical protein DPMN_072171 [Dreissena polymorpha]